MYSDTIWFFFIILLQFLFIISSLININTRLAKRRGHTDEESSSTLHRPDAGPVESDADFLARVLDNMAISNFKLKIRNEQEAIRFCEIMKIIPTKQITAPFCHVDQDVRMEPETKSSKLGWHYVYKHKTNRVRDCRFEMSPLVQTFVEKIRINCHQMLLFILCFVAELSNKQAGIEFNASKETVFDWLEYCRKVCEVIMLQQFKIGGILFDEEWHQFCDVVEMDETHIVRRKYARGRLLKTEDIWVISGISRTTKQCFAVRVPNRRIEVDWIVVTFIEHGSTIHTDQARVYQNLQRRFYDLYQVHRVNHKEILLTLETQKFTLKPFSQCGQNWNWKSNHSKAISLLKLT